MIENMVKATGMWKYRVLDSDGNVKEDWEEAKNIVPTEGLNDLLDKGYNGKSQPAGEYVGVIGSNSAPAAGWDYAGIGTDFTEWTTYDESTRESWGNGAASAGSTTNSTVAEFTSSSDSQTVYGGFLCTNSTKGDNTSSSSNVLIAALLFGSSKSLDTGEKLQIQYTLSLSSS